MDTFVEKLRNLKKEAIDSIKKEATAGKQYDIHPNKFIFIEGGLLQVDNGNRWFNFAYENCALDSLCAIADFLKEYKNEQDI